MVCLQRGESDRLRPVPGRKVKSGRWLGWKGWCERLVITASSYKIHRT